MCDYLFGILYHAFTQPIEVLILHEVVDITTKNKKINGWIISIEEQLTKLNLGSEEPQDVLINIVLLTTFQ
jgi:hypothetical protein